MVEIGIGDFIDRYIINEIKFLSVDLKIYHQLFDKNNLQKDKTFKEKVLFKYLENEQSEK